MMHHRNASDDTTEHIKNRDKGCLQNMAEFGILSQVQIFKRRLVAFKGGFVGMSVRRYVGPSVCRSVGLSSKKFSKSFEKEVLSIK